MAFLLSLVFLIVLTVGFLLFFYRNPERGPPSGDVILSPADGIIVDIEIDEIWAKIVIFMRLRDVHIQWVPYDGKIFSIKRVEGPCHIAYKPSASNNQQVVTTIQTKIGEIILKQIVGILARRIETFVKTGEEVKIGQRFGRIVFGSRVELWLPQSKAEVKVSKGQKVLAGVTVAAVPK